MPRNTNHHLWNDPVLQIEWPRHAAAILSAKDFAGQTMKHAATYEQHQTDTQAAIR